MPSKPDPSSLPQSFLVKKRRILESLSIPAEEYHDLSPKDSIDESIRDLIDEINSLEGFVTTSSCGGRVSVFLEGKRATERGRSSQQDEDGKVEGDGVEHSSGAKAKDTTAGVGGKGGGGRWLFVSHNKASWEEEMDLAGLLGMKRREPQPPRDIGARVVHFKFEPMILHILTASLSHAQMILTAALQAGFRESGALNLISATKEPATPMVAVRCMGLTLESLVGYHFEGEGICNVPESDLATLLAISNERFDENEDRIARFRTLLRDMINTDGVEKRKGDHGEQWEDPQARRERKRAEGLKKRQQAKATEAPIDTEDVADLGFLEHNT